MTGRLCTPRGVSIAVLLVASLFFAVGCGGGGTKSGSSDSSGKNTSAIVLGLQTPLGLQGTRGVGPEVTLIYRLRDREFDRSDVEIQYGIDLDRDDVIDEDTEYFAASEVPFDPNDPSTSSSGTEDLRGSPGVGTIQYFVWDSLADLGTGRYVTQDYVYTSDGRVQLDEFGEPLFQDFPGVRIRIRPHADGVYGAWKSTDAFDVNSNNTPSVAIGDVELTSEGTVNEDVVLNWTATDPDDDPITIAVDWVQVSESFDPSAATLETLEGLPWQAATTAELGDDNEGTDSLTSSRTGLPHVWAWDSVTDAGTMNGFIMFRMRPLDEKLEVGTWQYMRVTFHLDNYTIFTDPDAQLPDPSFHGRAVLLSAGQVLYAGGSTGTEPSTTAVIFYPGLSQTTKGSVAVVAGGMNEARMEHTATLLADGKVLITGGRGTGGTYLDTAEIYDPDAKSFTLLTETMQEARHNHAATLLRDGRVLLCGGANVDGVEETAEIFDPETETFASAGVMGEARTMAKAVLLPAGRVLVSGGEGALGGLETVEIFDPVSGSFIATDIANDMSQVRLGHSLTSTTHDPIAAVAAGGSDAAGPSATVDRFDWVQDTFTAGATMQDARSGHIAVLLGDGKILMAGGTSDAGIAPTGDIYDVDGDSMDTPNGEMLVPVAYASVACLVNGRPVIFGGQDENGDATAQIEVFTPDGGFNFPPVAQIRTPTSVEPWAFGVRFNWRATDIEGDDVKINAQFRIKPSATDDSGVLSSDILDVWLPASMKKQTVLGEVSSGVTGLSSREDFVTELQNPMDAPDVDPGEHLFVWFTEDDIPKGNYDNVFFRIQVQGATPGTTATSGRFSITENAPVIARIETPLNTSGNIVVPYYLQDSDQGDLARLVWEYGIDLNDDGKIVEADFEGWVTVTRSPVTVTVGTDSYTDEGLTGLVTGANDSDPNNDYTTADGIPWGKRHYMIWDSVYDLGAPVTARSDVILRATPYDYPSTSTDPATDESLGIDNTVGGFTLETDPNGLVLDGWTPTVNNLPGPGYTYTGVKLDEPIVLTFSKPLDPDTVDRDSIQFTKVGGVGERIDGYFHVDNTSVVGKSVVTFYPQMQEIPARTDIFEESTGYALFIPCYDPTNRTNPVVEQDGADPADTNGRYCLLSSSNPAALETGTGVLPDVGAPSVGPLVSPSTTTGVATGTGVELSFSERIAAGSVDADGFLVTTEFFAGVTSVVYGEMFLQNITEWDGTKIVHFAVLKFQPDSPLPVGATIKVAAKTGLTDLGGNSLASASTTTFDTVLTGTTKSGKYEESFDDATERDADLTTAFWGTTDPNGIGSGGGLGVSGSLTGMHEMGSGGDEGDIVWATDKTFTIDTDVQDEWEFESLTVPAGHTLILKGSKPAVIRVIGDVLVEGTIDAAGQNGEEAVWYDAFNKTGGAGVAGGRGGPGGGDGGKDGDYTWKQTVTVAPGNGTVGYGADSNGNGKAGGPGHLKMASSYYSRVYDYYGGGASGAGHASAGEDGTFAYYSGVGKKTVPKGGSSYGSVTLANGLEGGCGGGCGGSVVLSGGYTSGTYQYNYWGYASGGGGGGGGGAFQLIAGGTVTVTKQGAILANGGAGGDCHGYSPYNAIFYSTTNSSYTYYQGLSGYTAYPGGGGGGSGGTIHIKAGSGHAMHGVMDVSGGRGGAGYKRERVNSTKYAQHWGGAGGDGRLKVDGPDLIDPSDGVNFQGVVAVGTAVAISGGSGTTSWTVTSSTTVNTDTGSGAPSGTFDGTTGRFNLKDFTVNSGVTLTVTGSKPFLVYASGNVTVSGKINASGRDATDITYIGYMSSSYSGWRAYTRVTGAAAVAGGGNGGDSGPSNYGSYVNPPHPGTAGKNAWNTTNGGGQVSTGWTPWYRTYSYHYGYSGTRYHYYYYYFGGGGGGGGSAVAGDKGHPQLDGWTSVGYDGGVYAAGGTATVDASTLSETSLTGGGGGAGGGRNVGYRYYFEYLNSSGSVTGTYSGRYYSYGNAGAGGAGGGAVMIKTSGTLTMGSAASIDVSGGTGGDIRTTSYSRSLYSSPGGGGGGGNVLLEAKSGFSLGAGCSINASGGQAGVSSYKSSSSYYDYGTTIYAYGGDGGPGAVVLRAETLPEVLNVGQIDLGDDDSFDSGKFILTQDGVSKWQDTGTHAPDVLAMTTTGTGIANLYIEGAHINPMTGLVDESTATGWIEIADINDADGYRFVRFKCELAGSTVSGATPSIDSVTTTWESVH
ncbi:MAG: kelch repeat-containing protein [Planctomycetota bacterium]